MTQAAPAQKTMTHVAEALKAGAAYLKRNGIDVPQREAEHLFSAVLDVSRLHLFLENKTILSQQAHDQFWVNLRRRAAREPLQYITGQVEFCDMTLSVSKGVFIPRPETELIVEAAKTLPPPRRILDLCTGSGALAVALARAFPSAHVIGVDCSDEAIITASTNARNQGVASSAVFLQGDLFAPLKNRNPVEKFDLIVANPPYISISDRASLPPEVRDYEPKTALFAADEGRDFYRRILNEAPSFLTESGVILLELGQGQSKWLRSYVDHTLNPHPSAWRLDFIKDWAEIDRIACLSKNLAGSTGAIDG